MCCFAQSFPAGLDTIAHVTWTIFASVISATAILTLIRRLGGRRQDSHLGSVSQQWVAEHRLSHLSEDNRS